MFYKFITAVVLCFSATIALADDCIIDQYGTKICTNARSKSWEYTGASLYNSPRVPYYKACANREHENDCYLDGSSIVSTYPSEPSHSASLIYFELLKSYVSTSGKVRVAINVDYGFDAQACTGNSVLMNIMLMIDGDETRWPPSTCTTNKGWSIVTPVLELSQHKYINLNIQRTNLSWNPDMAYKGLIRINKVFVHIEDQ